MGLEKLVRPTAAHLEKIPSLCLALLLAWAQPDAMRWERVWCQEATPPRSRPPPQAVVKQPESPQQAGSNGNSHTTTRTEPPRPRRHDGNNHSVRSHN